ncbi:MAG: sigma-70 family RNA polymerase sigma factor [Nanoarchaeota archaeon]|nr:sigma-70 family RNA polymerase sigma factor [Nanoarchaeota archaeon]MBU1028225.1 sigma-70 family RNA polymerase sigma factor [Nanoarchaeota archaeon]
MDYSKRTEAYFAESGKYKPLSLEEEQTLARLIMQGDEKARDKLVRHNLSFANSVAINTARQRNAESHIDDLVQEAGQGMFEAAKRFEPRGYKFISYAVWWVNRRVNAYLSENKLIRKPSSQNKAASEIFQAKDHLEKNLQRTPNSDEIADYLATQNEKEYTSAQIDAVLELYRTTSALSMDAEYSDDDRTLIETIEDVGAESVETLTHNKNRKQLLDKVINNILPKVEREIIELHYWQNLSLSEIAEQLKLPREQVRQKKDLAQRRIKASLSHEERQKLNSYI